jgi:3-oxoacyl-[acyl-carrier-protein] synthase II
MKRRRVKITGIGPVTPAGIGREAFWKGILEPVSRVRPFTKLGDDFGPLVAAYIDGFDITDFTDRAVVPKGAARQSLFAIAGSILALKDAGLSRDELRSARSAVITGSCVMDFGGILSSIDGVHQRGMRAALPRTLYSIGVGSVPSAVNRAIGLSGRAVAMSTQCVSGLDAIGYAASFVANGEIDIAICGGTDAPLHRFPMLELRAAEVTSATFDMASRQARPFDLWRTAGVLAEGCSMFVLEPDHSRRAGYSYVAGYGFANDEENDMCGGLVDTAKHALAQARLCPSDVDVLNAWGPGDKRVDRGEAQAMGRIFGPRLVEIAATSIKGAIGSPLGAAPAIQIAAAALGQKFGIVPPTVNWEFRDPDCGLNLSARARSIPHRTSLVNAHGFGALNSSMILERC